MDGIKRATTLVECLSDIDAEHVLQRLPSRRAKAIRLRRADPILRHDTPDSDAEVIAQFLGEVQAEPAAGAPLASLDGWLPSRLAARLKGEMVQVAAVVLRQLTPSRAADVLSHFDAEKQIDIVQRMIVTDSVDGSILREIELSLLQEEPHASSIPINGAQYVARMLRHTSCENRQRLATGLRDRLSTRAEEF